MIEGVEEGENEAQEEFELKGKGEEMGNVGAQDLRNRNKKEKFSLNGGGHEAEVGWERKERRGGE